MFRIIPSARRASVLRRPSRRTSLKVEHLETRTLLSASLGQNILAKPAWHFGPTAIHNSTPVGYTPEQIRDAYGFDEIAFNNETVVGDGAGQTIAIVVAYSNPRIESDLNVFSKTFGLPDAKLERVSQTKNGRLPATDPGWALETALDVQWAHAIAPKADLLLVEAYSASFDDMFAAVDYARKQPGVSVVSMSWGAYEFFGETLYDSYFTTPAGHTGVTFVAASGDSGGITNYPSASPNVVSVGGTSLRLDANGSRTDEFGWYGSDGGVSQFVRKPSYQKGVNPAGVFRTTPDVSYNASMVYGVAVYNTVPIDGQTGWFELGGTSAGAPQWAGLLAIVNQGRALAGLSSLDGRTQTLPAIYKLPNSAFLDVSQGVSGLDNHRAGPGYDLVTGRGSPNSQFVVQGLVNVGANGGILPSVGPTQQTETKPGSVDGDKPRARAATNGNLAFLQALVSAISRRLETPTFDTQRETPRRTPAAPQIPVELTASTSARTHRATQGYKTAGGEEAPYWMEKIEESDTPDTTPQHKRKIETPDASPTSTPEVVPANGAMESNTDRGAPGRLLESPTPVQDDEGLSVRLSSAMVALAAVLGGFAGAHLIQTARGKRPFLGIPWLTQPRCK